MSFQISALSESLFRDLFTMPDDRLATLGALRVIATEKPGFPCRVSLADAEPGEELILVHYEHHAVDSPFRASHAVYVRRGAAEAVPAQNEVPEMLRSRTLSIRAFDARGMLLAADLSEGRELEQGIERIFRDTPEASYLHIHFAKPGCFAARADRA